MKVLVLFFVAIACVVATTANSLDTKSIKKNADDKYNVGLPDKQDKKNQKDSEGDKKEVNDDCDVKEPEEEKDKKEKEIGREKNQKEEEKKRKDDKEEDNEGKDSKEKDNKGKDNKEKNSKGNDSKEKDKKGKDSKEKDSKGNDSKEKDKKGDSKEKDSKEKDSKGNDSKEKENKGKDNKGKDNKGKDSKEKDSKEKDNKGKAEKVKGDKGKDTKPKDSKEKKQKGHGSYESGSNECESKETKDKKRSRESNKTKEKHKDGRKGDSSEEDCNDSIEDTVKKIWKERNHHHGGGKKPCGKPAEPTNCNTVCTLNSDPLCASPDGFEGDPKTFDNTCLLNVYNCQNPKAKYKKTSDGACKPVCPQICPYYVKPFCALPDGWCGEPQTFGNPCFLSVHNCEKPDKPYIFFHDGECLTTPAPEPDCGLIDCPQDVSPFCAIPTGFCGQPITFNNKCLLEVYNCFNPNEQYEYFHDGECLTTPAPEPECVEKACPSDNSPICTLPNGFCGEPKTFINECYREVYNAFNPDEQYEYFHDGVCLTTPAPEPDCAAISCSSEGPSICALPDGFCGQPMTFSNECNLLVYNCFNSGAEYKYFHDGKCIEQPKQCPTVCPYNYAPICGRGQSGNVQTFPNQCSLELQNCQNENDIYTFVHEGECVECDDILCNKIGQPICGINSNGDLQTFVNPCMLQRHNCDNCDDKFEYYYDGSCIEEPKCPTFCPLNYVPRCARGKSGNVQTFGNGCSLASHNCLNEDDQYTFLHEGECNECDDILCNKIGQLICATNSNGDLKTFGNPCMLQRHNCDNCNDTYEYLYDGSCIEEPKCPTFCPLNYVPKCAIGPSGDVRTFGNGCSLSSHNCLNENDQYTFIHEGECVECADIKCNKIGKPVCGTNSKGQSQTFGNLCMLQRHNCDNCDDKYEFSYDGSCVEPVICTKEYMPVCAISPTLGSRTFSNKCERDAYISQNPSDGYVAAYDGECKPVCKLGCPRIYRPVCGINSKGEEKPFSNRCEYEKHNCLNPNDQYPVTYEGECNHCDVSCIEIHDPVCTVDADGNEITYTNQCEFDRYNCRYPNSKHTFAYAGECNHCNVACLAIYDPVCATDSNGKEITYGSQCELDSNNCRYPFNTHSLKYKGECNNCRVACPRLFAPVCTYDSLGQERQFVNPCEFESYNCRYPNDQCTIAYEGECNNCRIGCPKIYAPVCTRDSNGKEKQFSNACEFESYNCLHKNDQCSLLYEGECHNCDFGCVDVYDPVCTVDAGGNERTYSNECELRLYNCRYPYNPLTVAYAGECHKCQTICLAIYKPVCAKDSSGNLKTYGNQCELDSYNCRYPYNVYTVQYQGECKKPCVDNCPADCKPVCASSKGDRKDSDARTFTNQCFLDLFNCRNPTKQFTKVADGDCPVECKKLKCSKEQNWICATSSDPKVKPSSFYNDCERVLHNCNNPKNKFYYSRDGECDSGC